MSMLLLTFYLSSESAPQVTPAKEEPLPPAANSLQQVERWKKPRSLAQDSGAKLSLRVNFSLLQKLLDALLDAALDLLIGVHA